MDINFLDTYTPSTIELSTSDVLSTRNQLAQYTRISFPDVANAPGSVIGDLIVTPQSYILTALEKGLERVLSDITLENVANGVVYNCDFVGSYLKNFGIDQAKYLPSSGVIRLIFSQDKQYELDRSTQFRVSNQIYSIYLPNDGNFYCVPSTETLAEGLNGCILKDTGSGSWFADVPVVGYVGESSISANSSGEISQYIEELDGITTLMPFSSGVLSDSIENLAKKTQTTSFSASLNTRYGAVQYINATCPFIQSTYALKDGDKELIRTYKNQYGIASGCMDIFVRSNSYEFTEKQQVKLVLDSATGWLEGDWHYVGQPYHLESITHPSINVKDIEDREIISTSDTSLGLGALACYTRHEKLKIRLKNVFQSTDFQLDSATGQKYLYVTVTYQTDPLFDAIAQTVDNKDYAPINVNIMTRGFIPVIISQFDVIYTKLPGVLPDLQAAKDKIKIYLGNVGAPNQFSIAEIADIMRQAGVNYVKGVDVTAKIQWSLGDKVQNFSGELEDVKQTEIRSYDELRAYYPNPDQTLQPSDMYACSPKIIRYFVLENSIKFKEVRDV